MIEKFNDNKNISELFDIIQSLDIYKDDFFLTKNNQRIYIKNVDSLKELLKESDNVYYLSANDARGVILIWRSVGEITRNYIKLIASDIETARKLVTVLLWNFKENVYIKIRKDSEYLIILKEKNFTFLGGRGKQILLQRSRSFGDTNNVSCDN